MSVSKVCRWPLPSPLRGAWEASGAARGSERSGVEGAGDQAPAHAAAARRVLACPAPPCSDQPSRVLLCCAPQRLLRFGLTRGAGCCFGVSVTDGRTQRNSV